MVPFREFFCEVDEDIGQEFLVEDVGGNGPLPKMGLKALEPDLDSNRPECRSLGPRPEEHVAGHIADRRLDSGPVGHVLRSEERRVGKECRYRWAEDDLRKRGTRK